MTAVLVAVAGCPFLLKAGGGLYWLIPAVLAGLVGGVINAWLFLVRIPTTDAGPYQPSSARRSSSMPKWWATSWMTVRRTSPATSSSVRQMAQIAWR